ncbi:dienelactone hydrolase family protein [Saccharibacillus sacchari]|uniref:dienelactone hydrolase family protein n=1 Tax=Saccharibacillus sacchari TaxID=456493 RepID=UPI0004B2542E|nr:alpha/beta hydrolase family protein [Saccharibacillus sacchari]
MNPNKPNTLEQFIHTLSESAPRRSEWEADIPFDQWQTELRQRFRERLGEFPSVPAALNPVLMEHTRCDGYVRERIEITTYEGLRMPLYLLLPDSAVPNFNTSDDSGHSAASISRPVVLAIHGHGYGSREIVGLHPDGSARESEPGLHKDFALSLVRQGFVVAAPELLGFGDRRLKEDLALAAEDPGKNSCFRLSSALLMVGQTMAGYRIYETMRALDYVQARHEFDSDKVGIMGISGGGLVAGFTAALDRRIGCTVVSGYTNTFAKSILSRNHCLDNYIPGILLEAEMPDLLGLIAPRGLFVESGVNDHLFGPAGVHEALDRLHTIFQAAGRLDGVEADIFTGGHEIHGDPAFAWLKRQLMTTTKEVRQK